MSLARGIRLSWVVVTLLVLPACQCGPGPQPEDGGAPIEELDAGQEDGGVVREPSLLHVEPPELTFTAAGQALPFKVIGLVEGGEARDVTAQAGFTLRDGAIASVTPTAVVTAVSRGRTAVDVLVGGLSAVLFVNVDIDDRAPSTVEFFNEASETGLRKPAWWGRTEPGALVTITGGTAPATAVAGDDGIFAIEVPLLSNTTNHLSVTLTDQQGNASPPYGLQVLQRDDLPRTGKLSLVSGNNQTGVLGAQTMVPLVAIATGAGGSPLGGQPVTFRVLTGGGSFAGSDSVVVPTEPDGRVRAIPTLGNATGRGHQLVMASLAGDWGQPVFFFLTGVVATGRPASVSGQVMTQDTTAVPGATLYLKDPRGVVLAQTVSDGRGEFRFTGVPAGLGNSLFVDGSSVTLPGKYPDLIFDVNVLAGIDNPMSAPVVLPRLPAGVVIPLDASGIATATTEIRVTISDQLPPLVLLVPQGTRVTFPAGLAPADRVLRVVSVPTFGMPMPFPNGLSSSNVLAIQPANTLFDPPLPIRLPNVDGIAPGEHVQIFSFDHVAKDYVSVGLATVDSSAQYLVSDPGVGVRKGAWHMAPPPDPCKTTACGTAGPWGATPDADCPAQPLECTCLANGMAAVPCKPRQQVCVPNVACGTDVQVIITCKPATNINDDGSTVVIKKPKNASWYQTKKDVVVEARTCPKGREAEILWSTSAPDAMAQGSVAGPVFRVRYDEEHTSGTLIKASFGKAQDAVTVNISDKCATSGMVQVCGTAAEPQDPDGNVILVRGPLRIGLDGQTLGVTYEGDAEVDIAGKQINGKGGALFLWVEAEGLGFTGLRTGPIKVPVFPGHTAGVAIPQQGIPDVPPTDFSINAATGRFGGAAAVGLFGALGLAARGFGVELAIKDVTLIAGGVAGSAELKLPTGVTLGGTDESYPFERVEIKEGELLSFRYTQPFKFELPKYFVSVEGAVKVNFPESAEIEGTVFFGRPPKRTKGINASVAFNWKKAELTFGVGVKDFNIVLPGAAAWAAVQDLGFKFVTPFGELKFNPVELSTRVTNNDLRTDFAKDAFSLKATGKADFWETFELSGELSMLKNFLKLGKAVVKLGGEHLVSLVGNLDWTLDPEASKALLGGGFWGNAAAGATARTGLFGTLRFSLDRGGVFSGSADVTMQVVGYTVIGEGVSLAGALSGDPWFSLTTRVGPMQLPVVGQLPSQSIKFLVDGHGPWTVDFLHLHIQKCADYREETVVAWAGAPVSLTMPAGVPGAMILLKRQGASAPGDFTLQLPSGTVVGPTGAPGVGYFQDGDTGNSYYLLASPDGGTYQVSGVADGATATSVALMLPNAVPTIALQPVRRLAGGDLAIDWLAGDADDVAKLALFYDVDATGFDGAPISGAGQLSESDGPGTFTWATADVPSGWYYVYAVLDDGHDHPQRVYAPNQVRVVDPLAPPVPTGLRATAVPGGFRLAWASVPGASYGVRLERDGRPVRSISAGGDPPNVFVGDLQNGADYRASVVATNGDGRSSPPSDAIELRPRLAGFNAPGISSSPCVVARVDVPWMYGVAVRDADTTDTVRFTLEAGPPGMTLSSIGLLSWTPGADQVGFHDVTVRVEDGAGLTASQRFRLNVAPSTTFDLDPEIVSPAPTAVSPGQAFQQAVRAIDPDGDGLTFSLEVAPTTMAIDTSSGVVTWTPALTDFAAGRVAVVIKVSDGRGGEARQHWSLSVEDSDGDGLRDGFELGLGLDPLQPDSDTDGTADGLEDLDGDGLDNLGEQAAGSSPALRDTDGDTLNDAAEVTAGSDPTRTDTDGDGLDDLAESTFGTSPTNPDTDGDGARDGDEVAYGANPQVRGADADSDTLSDDLEQVLGLDPTKADTDGDTLNDALELGGGTNPLLRDSDGDGVDDAIDPHATLARDTDGDGLSDDREVVLGTNPENADTDGDGRSDATEVAAGLDPLSAGDNPLPPPLPSPVNGRSKAIRALPEGVSQVGVIALGTDSDLDGIPDEVEVRYSLDPNSAPDALADADGDGLSNLEEYRLGTDPTRADTDGDGVSDADEARVGTDPLDPLSNRNGVTVASLEVVPAIGRIALNTLESPRPYPLTVRGTLSDSSLTDLTPATRGTTYTSSEPTRLSVSADGELLPTAGPDVTVTITARNGTQVASSSFLVTTFDPIPVGSLALGASLRRINKVPGLAFISTDTGVSVVSTAFPSAPRLVSSVPFPGGANDALAVGRHLYVATGSGVTFLDFMNPNAPQQVGFVPVAGGVTALAVEGSFIFATSGARVVAIRAQAPTAASLVDGDGNGVDDRVVGSVTLPGGAARRLAVNGGTVAVDAARRFTLVDVRQPAAPLLLGSTALGGGAIWGGTQAIDLGSTVAFTIDSARLVAIDVSAPLLPRQVGATSSVMAPNAVDVLGPYAFVADGSRTNGLLIWRTADPTQLEPFAGSLDFSTIAVDDTIDLVAEGAFVYAIGQAGRLYVGQYLDFTDAGGRAPEVEISAPAGGSAVVENLPFQVCARVVDDVQVASVRLLAAGVATPMFLAGVDQFCASIAAPPVSAGTLVLRASATDSAGNTGTSAPVSVTLSPDRPPSVLLVEPLAGSTRSGLIRLVASATDDVQVDHVEFRVDGAPLGSVSSPPYELLWDAVSFTNGRYNFTAVATDSAGQTSQSTVAVDVFDEAPEVTITSPAQNAQVSGPLTIAATVTDDVGVASVDLLVDGALIVTRRFAPYTLNWDSCTRAEGTHTLAVRATDRHGNVTTTSKTIEVNNLGNAPVLDGNPGQGKITLAFSGCGVFPSYNLYWATSPGVSTSSTLIANASNPFEHGSLSAGTNYSYRVAAVNAGLESPLSNELTLTPGATGLCSAGGLCLSYPKVPTNVTIDALWGFSANDVWAAAGGWGFLLHWDGTAWSNESGGLPVGAVVRALWGPAPGDLWAAGSGGLLAHWDGARWTPQASGTTANLTSVWGSGSADVWAVGTGGTIVHWDGGAWSASPSGTTSNLNWVWGLGATDVYAVGTAGTVRRWGGSSWVSGNIAGQTGEMWSIWGTSAADLWMATGNGAWGMLHFDGTSWTFTPSVGSCCQKTVVTGTGPNDVLVSGGSINRWDGSAWSQQVLTPLSAFTAAWSAGGEVWLGGAGSIVRRTGPAAWSTELGAPLVNGSVTGLWGSSTSDVWAVGTGIERWNGTQASWVVDAPLGGATRVWGSGPTDVHVTAFRSAMRWDGAAWTSTSIYAGGSNPLTGVWGTSATDAWVVGNDGSSLAATHRWNGATWTRVFPSAASNWFSAVGGVAANRMFMVGANQSSSFEGSQGRVHRFNGSSILQETTPAVPPLRAVWAADLDNAWAVGLSGTILRFDGGSWGAADAGLTEHLYAVAGTAADDVWAGGVQGSLLHWDGSSWSNQGAALAGVLTMATIGGEIWAGGTENTLMRWDGVSWTTVQSALPISSNGRYASMAWVGNNEAWVVGRHTITNRALLLRWNGVSWSTAAMPAVGPRFAPVAVWGSSPTDVWAVGGLLTAHFDGSTWSFVANPLTTGANLTSVWGSAGNDVWATFTGLGNTGILHWDGTAWSQQSTGISDARLIVWGASANDVWAAGSQVIHWDGASWSVSANPCSNTIRAIWGSSSTDVWAGGNGTDCIAHWGGASWTTIPGVHRYVSDLWGTGPNDVWSVGNDALGSAVIHHWDGTSWAVHPTFAPSSASIGAWSALRGSASGEMFLLAQTGIYVFRPP